ncbi:MAG: bifunctional diaminohydroxyphosphoribosylaminopyrimidine deaminase/5-amino-6-(5-phosphoribosylamino)uracil reductase RibD [Acidobacteriota bacterium]|nr:bifunctional diaminohydroxyphosphoribosylaminopyrimidine deaminase/5-amino-6-(5-phosphoribosylamino)uracil reductase RibD [Acidobacteriota bacterium]
MPELDSALAWDLACGGPFPDPALLLGDERFMALALKEAQKGVGLSSPNPPVGCVLVKDGRVLGQGAHSRAGDPHGEIIALMDAEARGHDVSGATAYVTLEPCCHHGRTPPCTDALLQAGIRRAVVGVRDPNPRVDGGGLAILRAAGLEVHEGVLFEACARFHGPFFKLIQTGLPWVSLKLALGSDGALGPEGETTPVTPLPIQSLAHALRRASDAILVGRGTIAQDDPQLTDRWPEPIAAHRRFTRVVLDPLGKLGPEKKVWKPYPGQPALRILVGEAPPLRGVEDLHVPPSPTGPGCSLRHLLHELSSRGIGRVLVEGGARTAQAFLAAGLVDQIHLFRSTKPAGGVMLNLDGISGWKLQAETPWSTGEAHGTWDILVP